MVNGKCIFGVGDLPRIIARPELLAHRFNLNKQPAAFFCLYKHIRQRSFNKANQKKFSASQYSRLPQIQVMRGIKNLKELDFFFV